MDGSPSYHTLQQPSSNGSSSTEMEAARLTAHSKEWGNQLLTLYIEHSPEILALSNCDCPHWRLRSLWSNLAAIRELSEMPWAHSSLLKILAKSHTGQKRKQALTSFTEWCCTREPSFSTPLFAVPIQLDLLTRSQGAQQKETGPYVRGSDSFTNEVFACIVGVRKGSINLTGKEYKQHPSTARRRQTKQCSHLTKTRYCNRILLRCKKGNKLELWRVFNPST